MQPSNNSSTDPRAFHVVVVGGGALPPAELANMLPRADAVICADRGYSHARTLGLEPTLLVGDFDSLSSEQLDHARSLGIQVETHPPDKDATDLELALDHALSLAHANTTGHVTFTVVATPDITERVDHLLSQLGLLASPKYARVVLRAWLGEALLTIIHPETSTSLEGRPGELVTLIPVGDSAHGVTTHGLQYPLHAESLSPFSTRGVSNQLSASIASVSITNGVVAVVQPHALQSPALQSPALQSPALQSPALQSPALRGTP